MASLEDTFIELPAWGKGIGLVALLALLSVGYYTLVHGSIASDLKSGQAQKQQLQDQIRDAERREKQYLELTQELANREAADRQNRRVLPEDSEIATFLQDLNRVAELQGVPVLNINELANAVKSVLLPGEPLLVDIIQEGKESGQGVGYLDDGTMVVVEDGRGQINQQVTVVVTKVLQTAAGRMIFAQINQ